MYCSGCLRRIGSAKLFYSLTDVAPVKSRLNSISRVLDATGTGNTNTTTRCLSKLAYQEDELYEKSHITFLHKPNAQGRPSPSTLVTSFSHKGFTLNLDSQVTTYYNQLFQPHSFAVFCVPVEMDFLKSFFVLWLVLHKSENDRMKNLDLPAKQSTYRKTYVMICTL